MLAIIQTGVCWLITNGKFILLVLVLMLLVLMLIALVRKITPIWDSVLQKKAETDRWSDAFKYALKQLFGWISFIPEKIGWAIEGDYDYDFSKDKFNLGTFDVGSVFVFPQIQEKEDLFFKKFELYINDKWVIVCPVDRHKKILEKINEKFEVKSISEDKTNWGNFPETIDLPVKIVNAFVFEREIEVENRDYNYWKGWQNTLLQKGRELLHKGKPFAFIIIGFIVCFGLYKAIEPLILTPTPTPTPTLGKESPTPVIIAVTSPTYILSPTITATPTITPSPTPTYTLTPTPTPKVITQVEISYSDKDIMANVANVPREDLSCSWAIYPPIESDFNNGCAYPIDNLRGKGKFLITVVIEGKDLNKVIGVVTKSVIREFQ